MAEQSLPDSVPEAFKRFFWDIAFEKLSPREKPYYVINSLLDKGDLAAARWVVRTFPKEMIIDTLKTMRDFSPRSGTFWQRYLNIPKEEVLCLQESYLTMRRTHWPF